MRVSDANDIGRIEEALTRFKLYTRPPTLIVLDSHIGYGAPINRTPPKRTANRLVTKRSGSRSTPTAGLKTRSSWYRTASMSISTPALARVARLPAANGPVFSSNIERSYPGLATEIEQMQRRDLPDRWDRNLPVFPADAKGMAGREASGKALNILAQIIPWFLGGSADLGPSNKTLSDL